MGWFSNKIDVTIPHKLGCNLATKRLQQWSNEFQTQNTNPKIKLVQATWITASESLNLILNCYDKEVKVTVLIAPEYVKVSSEPLPFSPLLGVPVVWYVTNLLTTGLTKALA